MADLSDIREGIAVNLRLIPSVQVSAYMLGNPTPPSIEVMPDETDYDKTFQRGTDRWFLKVRAFVGKPSDIGAQKRLDEMLASSGPLSVKANIEVDCTLDGVVDDLRVTKCSGYRTYGQQPGVLGAEWVVEVWADGF